MKGLDGGDCGAIPYYTVSFVSINCPAMAPICLCSGFGVRVHKRKGMLLQSIASVVACQASNAVCSSANRLAGVNWAFLVR